MNTTTESAQYARQRQFSQQCQMLLNYIYNSGGVKNLADPRICLYMGGISQIRLLEIRNYLIAKQLLSRTDQGYKVIAPTQTLERVRKRDKKTCREAVRSITFRDATPFEITQQIEETTGYAFAESSVRKVLISELTVSVEHSPRGKCLYSKTVLG